MAERDENYEIVSAALIASLVDSIFEDDDDKADRFAQLIEDHYHEETSD